MDRQPANPKVLLVVAAAVGLALSAIGIFLAVGHPPDSGSSRVTAPSTAPVPRP